MSTAPLLTDAAVSDLTHILHPASSIAAIAQSGPRIITGGRGLIVRDSTGHEAIDGIAGLWCANVGHGREEIAQAMADAVRTLDYFHTFGGHSNPGQIALAERLVALAPDNLTKVFFGSSGSDANDTILKIVWHVNNLRGRPEKKKIISRWQAYHGTSISTASLTGLKGFHTAFDLPLPGILHADCPHYVRFRQDGESEAGFTARMLANLEALIESEGPETIAAFIGEPIMGAGGVIPPPAGYWQGVEALCRQHDILLIADEVVCGYGRTGAAFGCQTYGFTPDLMATAKGLTAGVFPMSAVFMTENIFETLTYGSETLGNFSHGYTYSGHPVGAAVASTVLQIIEDEGLIENAAKGGAYLHEQLAARLGEHPHIGEIRGKGLLAGIQLMNVDGTFPDPVKKTAAKVAEACYRRGLIVRPLPSVTSLALSPPLTVGRADIDLILDRFEAGLAETLGR